MQLENENYHSKEANKNFLSVSQYKNFYGSTGRPGCEARAIAELKGEYIREKTDALYIGSYVDAHFSGELDKFKSNTPEIFKKDGNLKSAYLKADEVIKRAEKDKLFMKYISGKKQVIMTANMFGVEWKIAIDSYLANKAIVDLKLMASIRKNEWVKGIGKVNFVEYWGYDIQLAVYQKIVEINTGKILPCYIACLSKEKVPDLEIIGVDNEKLEHTLQLVSYNVKRIVDLKEGKEEPVRCGECGYCKETKVLTRVIHYLELNEDF